MYLFGVQYLNLAVASEVRLTLGISCNQERRANMLLRYKPVLHFSCATVDRLCQSMQANSRNKLKPGIPFSSEEFVGESIGQFGCLLRIALDSDPNNGECILCARFRLKSES